MTGRQAVGSWGQVASQLSSASVVSGESRQAAFLHGRRYVCTYMHARAHSQGPCAYTHKAIRLIGQAHVAPPPPPHHQQHGEACPVLATPQPPTTRGPPGPAHPATGTPQLRQVSRTSSSLRGAGGIPCVCKVPVFWGWAG